MDSQLEGGGGKTLVPHASRLTPHETSTLAGRRRAGKVGVGQMRGAKEPPERPDITIEGAAGVWRADWWAAEPESVATSFFSTSPAAGIG
jgi:hypothetical protein